MIEREPSISDVGDPDISFVNISLTKKPAIDYAGMLIIGADIDEFPELKELVPDSND